MMELTDALPALALKELELDAQGYPPHQVRAASRFALRQAEGVAMKAPAPYQEAVFLARLEDTLEAAGRWLDGNRRAAAEGDMESGVDRARRERRAHRGYRRMGLDGSPAADRWGERVEADKAGYAEFWKENGHGAT